MKWRVTIRPRAERDLSEARNWYEGQSTGLGDKFVEVMRSATLGMEVNAEVWPEYYRGFRRVLLSTFPYKVFYRLVGDRVIVFRILHAGQEHQRLLRVR